MEFDVTSYPLSWFKDRYGDETLTIKPPYQRRPVWGVRQKAKLIESILLDLPIPELFIDETTDEDGNTQYAIIDGQQRTRAVLQFLGLDRDPLEQEYNEFALETLDSDAAFKDKGFNDLTSAQKKKFFGYKFAIRRVYNPSDIEVRATFRRINEYLTKLNDQELRNATYSGPFVTLVDKYANDDFWKVNGFFKTSHIRRMKDLQFVSELFIGVAFGPQSGASKAIDEHYKNFEEFDDEIPGQEEVVARYDYALSVMKSIFPDWKQAGRFKNLADFYTLFVAIASLKREGRTLPQSGKSLAALRAALDDFAAKVDARLAGVRVPSSKVGSAATKYARAVEKGVNDKSRRGARHDAILGVLGDFTS